MLSLFTGGGLPVMAGQASAIDASMIEAGWNPSCRRVARFAGLRGREMG